MVAKYLYPQNTEYNPKTATRIKQRRMLTASTHAMYQEILSSLQKQQVRLLQYHSNYLR
jgi:hypothetical protein